MNILPKKSWHVLSKKNIERVRRDEAQARAEEEEKAQRAALAEQESRLSMMRKRARLRDGEEEDDTHEGARGREGEGKKQRKKECSVTDASGHINFFTDLQKGVGLQVGNADRDKEMKQEQEKLEKRIGLLNYLVDKDKSDTEPWYVKSGGKEAESEAKRKSAKAEHRKELMDPLLSMKQYVQAKKKSEDVSVKARPNPHSQDTWMPSLKNWDSGLKIFAASQHNTYMPEEGLEPYQYHREKSSRDASSSDRHRSSKHKHSKHRKDHDKKSDLERLRRERRKREEGERAREEALMRGLEEGGRRGERSEPLAVEQVQGRYNSQFNPHLARQQ